MTQQGQRHGDSAPALGDPWAAGFPRRPRLLVALHWSSVLVLVAGLGFALARELVEARAGRAGLLDAHRWCGLALLGLCAWRGLLRLRLGRLPRIDPASTWHGHAAASAVHAVLYALLAAVPLLGWALSSAADQPLRLFGGLLPQIVAADEDTAEALRHWHTLMAWTLVALATAHAAAALWHHFVKRDGVLRAMWPGAAPRRAPQRSGFDSP